MHSDKKHAALSDNLNTKTKNLMNFRLFPQYTIYQVRTFKLYVFCVKGSFLYKFNNTS